MGRIFVVELEGRAYTHLALADDIVSKAFFIAIGENLTYSTASRVNVRIGEKEERMMLSGMHTVADVFCCLCDQIVGWKYEAAHERSQKYKEGKFVLERDRIVDDVGQSFSLLQILYAVTQTTPKFESCVSSNCHMARVM